MGRERIARVICVDTSAILAVLLHEPDRHMFRSAIRDADALLLSTATLVELRVVCTRRGGAGLISELDMFIDTYGFQIVPVDAEQADIAHSAFTRFGKGSGHPAQLNYGDLFAYALAKARGIPLLFKGEDFALTDIAMAA